MDSVPEGEVYRRGQCTGGDSVPDGTVYRRGQCTGGGSVPEGAVYRRVRMLIDVLVVLTLTCYLCK